MYEWLEVSRDDSDESFRSDVAFCCLPRFASALDVSSFLELRLAFALVFNTDGNDGTGKQTGFGLLDTAKNTLLSFGVAKPVSILLADSIAFNGDLVLVQGSLECYRLAAARASTRTPSTDSLAVFILFALALEC